MAARYDELDDLDCPAETHKYRRDYDWSSAVAKAEGYAGNKQSREVFDIMRDVGGRPQPRRNNGQECEDEDQNPSGNAGAS
jgi:hypothetical protein